MVSVKQELSYVCTTHDSIKSSNVLDDFVYALKPLSNPPDEEGAEKAAGQTEQPEQNCRRVLVDGGAR